MSPSVASKSTNTAAGYTTGDMTITKPSGVLEGDLLIAHLTLTQENPEGTVNLGSFDVPSGWTSLISQKSQDASQQVRMQVMYKVAGTSEPSSYTFSPSGSESKWSIGTIYRVVDQGDAFTIQSAFDDKDETTTPSFATTITPTHANSLLLMLLSATDNQASGSTSGYAISTDDPSWTEEEDSYGDASGLFGSGRGDSLHAGASATRPETTGTGNASLTMVNFTQPCMGALVVIGLPANVTVSPAVISLTAAVQAPAIAGDANVPVDVIDLTASVQDPAVSTPDPDWINEDKPATADFVNEAKP